VGVPGPPFGVCRGAIAPGSRVVPPRIFFASGNVFHFLSRFSCRLDFRVHSWVVFWHMVFADGFLFPVKESLLTNPGHWVRVLDAAGSYMYIVL
jgi:hypothetical protein